MSKSVNAGELRTRIAILRSAKTKGDAGYKETTWTNVFGEGAYVRCHWENVHGTEALTAASMDLKEPATLTMRYSGRITPECRILRKGDERPYEIISIDNVNMRNQWLEVKVKRTVHAK